MKHRYGQVFTCFFGLFLLAAPLAASADQTARQILARASLNQAIEPTHLKGRLRIEGIKIPFDLILQKNTAEYQFHDPEQSLILNFKEKPPSLMEKANGVTTSVTGAKLAQKIRNTGVTYGDISLRFLNWPDPVLAGEDTIALRKAWKLDIPSPDRQSQYSKARVWIDQESGMLMRMEGYDPQGNLLKRFEVISTQKLKGRWMLKQMRIEDFDLATHKVVSRTYLEITDDLG
ncbi:MAG: outer membrane lipoprotein-sorting protein [Chthoniobacterales bacterium]